MVGEGMEVESALDLINALVYKPHWGISATDHRDRFEGSVVVRIDYPARSSNRDEAPKFTKPIMTYATFPLVVQDCDDVALYRQIAKALIAVEVHEMREFLRVRPTMWAPFHPHRVDGMKRWGEAEHDLVFGIA